MIYARYRGGASSARDNSHRPIIVIEANYDDRRLRARECADRIFAL